MEGMLLLAMFVPRKLSAACSLFLQDSLHCSGATSSCFSADWPQGGLEVPCTYNYSLCTMPFLCGSHHNKILAEVKFGG